MPKLMLYFENAVAAISEHPDGYAIFTYRAGPRAPTDFRAALIQLGTLLYQRQWHRIVDDQRLMAAATAEESALIAAYWQKHTQVLGHGICVASVVAQDVFARLAATQLRADLKVANVSYKLFDEEVGASAWLREQTEVVYLRWTV